MTPFGVVWCQMPTSQYSGASWLLALGWVLVVFWLASSGASVHADKAAMVMQVAAKMK